MYSKQSIFESIVEKKKNSKLENKKEEEKE